MKSRLVMQLARTLRYTSRKVGTKMPYIPMTEAEKRAIVKAKLEKLSITVSNDDSWLDVQILAKQNGLDITQLLKPFVPDHMMMDKNTKDNLDIKPIEGEDIAKDTNKKIAKPKQEMGFSKQETKAEVSDETDYPL